MPAVAITREEHSAADLRREARRTKDADAARRMLALALVLEGWSRTEAARACGMDRQTLRDWVHRYNTDGLAGLSGRPRSGRPPRLTADPMRELEALVEQGPDPDQDGVVRWHRIDLAALIATRFKPLKMLVRPKGFEPLTPDAWLVVNLASEKRMVLLDRIELSTSPFVPLPLSRPIAVSGLDHPFTVTRRSVGAARLASTPSRSCRVWLGIGIGPCGPLAFPDFGRFAPDRFRSGRQLSLPRECSTTERQQRYFLL